ncbi:MAG: FHA domain-containing protein [Pseudomonadota bacterium]
MKFIRDIIAEKRNSASADTLILRQDELVARTRDDEDYVENDLSAGTPEVSEAQIAEVANDLSQSQEPKDHADISDVLPGQEHSEVSLDTQISGILDSLNDAPQATSPLRNPDPSETSRQGVPSADSGAEHAACRDDSSPTDLSESHGEARARLKERDAKSTRGTDEPATGLAALGMLKRGPEAVATRQVATNPDPVTGRKTESDLDEPGPAPDPVERQDGGKDVVAVTVPRPAKGRSAGRSGRVKTRILGFSGAAEDEDNPFAKVGNAPTPEQSQFPVGWLIVIAGPGRGHAITLFDGVSQIGRGESQAVRLDFGDSSVSRENHAAIAFDSEQNTFFIGHGGKSNLVRVNNRPVLSTQPLSSGDTIRLGETSLRFIGLCGPDFSWCDA